MASLQGFYNGNITSLDDRLLRAGTTVMVGVLIAFVFYFSVGGTRSNLQLGWLIGMLVAAVSLLVVGFSARKREKKCVGLWRLMQTHPDVQLSLYLQQSGNSLSDVQHAARTINDAGAGLLVVDTINDRLYDNRLSSSEDVTFQCQNCGASSTATVGMLDGSSVVCQYCEAPAPQELMSQAGSKQENLVRSNAERMGLLSESGKNQQGKINIPILLVLLIVFWPAAIVYVIKANNSAA